MIMNAKYMRISEIVNLNEKQGYVFPISGGDCYGWHVETRTLLDRLNSYFQRIKKSLRLE